jgi:hypothetical protein
MGSGKHSGNFTMGAANTRVTLLWGPGNFCMGVGNFCMGVGNFCMGAGNFLYGARQTAGRQTAVRVTPTGKSRAAKCETGNFTRQNARGGTLPWHDFLAGLAFCREELPAPLFAARLLPVGVTRTAVCLAVCRPAFCRAPYKKLPTPIVNFWRLSRKLLWGSPELWQSQVSSCGIDPSLPAVWTPGRDSGEASGVARRNLSPRPGISNTRRGIAGRIYYGRQTLG